MKQIDNLINTKLRKRFGKSLERRDYYKLELKKEFLKGKGEKNGIMFLVDVDYSHYIDINVFKSGEVKFSFRKDDDKLIAYRTKENIDEYLNAFLFLIEEYKFTNNLMKDLSKGIIPKSIKRNILLNNVLED
jgi:hypothetical protein